MNLRKLNMYVVICMFVTFLIHAIAGSLKLLGGDTGAMKAVAWVSVGFVCVHIVITGILTGQSLKARRLSGAGYFKDNKLFWTRRISGFAIIIPLIMHLLIFDQPSGTDAFRLQVFTTGRMISQILLVATIAVHVLTNIKPVLIALGVRDRKAFAVDLLLVIAIILLLAAAAFAVYYARWMNV